MIGEVQIGNLTTEKNEVADLRELVLSQQVIITEMRKHNTEIINGLGRLKDIVSSHQDTITLVQNGILIRKVIAQIIEEENENDK